MAILADSHGRLLLQEDTCKYCGEHLGWMLPGGEGLRLGFCGGKKCERARKEERRRRPQRKEGA